MCADFEKRYRDLQGTDLEAIDPAIALATLGELVDLATDRQDHHTLAYTLKLASALEPRLTRPAAQTELHYFVGNAWSSLQRSRRRADGRIWDWQQAECEQAVIAYRRSIASPGFKSVSSTQRARTYTNLANLLDHLGRYIDAIDLWDRALKALPGFGMARGNRALGLLTYADCLYDGKLGGIFAKTAYQELAVALTGRLEGDAERGFQDARTRIEGNLSPGFLSAPLDLSQPHRALEDDERAFRNTLAAARLFLNPLNDLGPHAAAARDTVNTPRMIVPIAGGKFFGGLFSHLKQEYVAARYFYYEGTNPKAGEKVHLADRDVPLTDTLDYPSYGIRTEYLRASFRLTYSVFDKIAFFLNHYLDLRINDENTSFRGLWFVHQNEKKGLRHEVRSRENLPLRGLYWLARDLAAENDHVTGPLDPDAQALAEIRNALEHRYLKLHTEGPVGPRPRRGSGFLADTLALSIDRTIFAQKCRRLLRLCRAALLYLAMAIHREELKRARHADPKQLIPGLRFKSQPPGHRP